MSDSGIEVGFTCDDTLCPASCADQELVGVACNGLSACDVSAIIELEAAAGCSCCASQICGCEPNAATCAELAGLREEHYTKTQCAQNNTLCGWTDCGS